MPVMELKPIAFRSSSLVPLSAPDAEDEEDNGFDLKNWSPLTEVYDSMPTFSAGA